MTEQELRAFAEAYLQKDIETVMSSIADDCVYITTTGPGPGTVYTGKDDVHRGFVDMLAEDDDGSTLNIVSVFVSGSRGALEWSISQDGVMTMRGCDLYEFEGNKIRRKDVFRKVLA